MPTRLGWGLLLLLGGVAFAALNTGNNLLYLLVGLCLAAMAVSFVAVPFAGTITLLIVPLVVSAIGRGIAQPSMMSMVSSYSTEHTRGLVMGVFSSRSSLARALGPAPAGLLFDQWLAMPFLLAAGLMLVALVLCAPLPARVQPAIGRE